ncbi:translational GTPase TypA [Paraliomyxa miuraensis]|uniref:translational GTPase TypA n=1 Tax=Paraliomyxa miuraensis TaxID=376150 RepID=UPI00225A2CDD|nr:translational GTPase TypA [Paraliomyxa miuraensis]MCX4239917.1 translational GTPase TypA [Paraliomyxa miuraensis]
MASHRSQVRNVAIIAHVDHGKTTLVDSLLSISGAFARGEGDVAQAMDSGDLERERGITITSKPTALAHGDVRVNLVDTPGHADFGGEVERVLNMVDAVLLIVDAVEGPMPQTRFVTEKAVKRGLKVLLVVNKIDRAAAEPHRAVDATFDLLAALDASEEQLDFPVIYTSAVERYALHDPEGERLSMTAVLDMVIEHAPAPEVDVERPPAMWVSTLLHDPYLGYLAIGRIRDGRIEMGRRLALMRPAPATSGQDASEGAAAEAAKCEETFRVSKILGFQGLHRFELERAEAGDIVAVAGMSSLQVGDTLTAESPDERTVFPALTVDPPTMTMRFRVNDGPFAGLEGQWVTSRKLRERLMREIKSNVALQVEDTESPDEFEVRGRGELHLSVLIETMRREGYELCVSRPRVILRESATGKSEPYERVVAQCDTEYTGAVIERLGKHGEMLVMEEEGPGRTRMEFRVPTRALIGYRSEFLTQTRGTGVLSSIFDGYGRYLGPIRQRGHGVIIVQDPGETITYSLHRLQDRGTLFVGPQLRVYAGMIIGAHSRDTDLIVNPCITKKLTNVRSAGADEKLFLTPPKLLSLEQALAFIEDDELCEVTPKSLRLRKRVLDHNLRKRDEKRAAEAV